MPAIDGLTCVCKIREMEEEGLIHGRLPIIAVTANARAERIASAKDSGHGKLSILRRNGKTLMGNRMM